MSAAAGLLPGAARLAPYRTRNVRGLGVETIAEHTIKLYALEAEGRSVSPALLAQARPVIAAALAARAERFHEHSLGFAILHAGEDAFWLLVDRWIDGAILCHRLFSAPLGGPMAFEDRSRGDLCFCVWEGAIVDFERRAFTKTMMRDRPDPNAYLGRILANPV